MSIIWNICFMATCFAPMIFLGCSGNDGSNNVCPVILNSKNGNQKLKLAPNSQQKNYAGLVSCGSKSPVLVGMFESCLDADSDKNQITSLFASYCGGTEERASSEGTTASPTALGFKTVASHETFKYQEDGKEVVAKPSPAVLTPAPSTKAPSSAPTEAKTKTAEVSTETPAPVITTAPSVETAPAITSPPIVVTLGPSVRTSPPSVRTSLPTVKTSPPTVKTSPPTVKTSPPTVKTSPPTVKTSVETAAPTIITSPPTAKVSRQKSSLSMGKTI